MDNTNETPGSMATGSIIDRDMIDQLFEGDHEFFQSVVEIFLEGYRELLEEIATALKANDADTLTRNAHALKGSVGNFGMGDAYHTALRLEGIGSSGDLSTAPEEFAKLETEVEAVVGGLRELSKAKSDDSN